MKHIITALVFGVLFLSLSTTANAQYGRLSSKHKHKRKSYSRYQKQFNGSHGKGNVRAHLGLGFPSNLKEKTIYFEGEANTITGYVLPPVNLSAEVGVHNKISVGLSFTYSQQQVLVVDVDYNRSEWKKNYYVLGLKGSLHPFGGKGLVVDPYFTVTAGYDLGSFGNQSLQVGEATFQIEDDRKFFDDFGYYAHIGANFMLHENGGLFIEGGIGMTNVNIGLVAGF